MTDKSEIRRALWNSLDMVCLRRDLILFPLAALVGALCGIVRHHPYQDSTPWLLAAFVFAVIALPVLVYVLWNVFRIFRHLEDYSLCRVKLVQPHGGFWRGTMYFTVVIEAPDGTRFAANTRAIFATRGLSPTLEEYLTRTVTVAYNWETQTLVVLG